MSPVSRYGRLYARGAYYTRVRTIIAVALHDKRIAVGIMVVFLLLLFFHIL
jgi:hypothetical protein